MQVRQFMRYNLLAIDPEESLENLVRHYEMLTVKSRLTYVTDEDKVLIGVISMFDIITCCLPMGMERATPEQLLERARLVKQFKARDIMTNRFLGLKTEESILTAASLIQRHHLTALPVLDEQGRLVGEVTRRTVLEFITDLMRAEERGSAVDLRIMSIFSPREVLAASMAGISI